MLAACSGVSEPERAPETPSTPDTDSWCAPWHLLDVKMGTPGTSTISAGFTETRSHLAADDTRMKVLWTSGDSFAAYCISDDFSEAYYTVYSTTDSGPVADFTSKSALPDGPRYYIYPGVTTYTESGKTYHKLVQWNSQVAFGVIIPSNQTAVPGDIAEGLNVSYSYYPTATDDITF